MSAAGLAYPRADEKDAEERRVTPLELFFDLVFVFAITQVTGLLSEEPTPLGLLRGMALLAALWWAWVCYSWLTNTVRAEDATPARLVVLSVGAVVCVRVGVAGPPIVLKLHLATGIVIADVDGK